VAAAPVRTVAAGTARLFYAWATGSPVPEAADRRGEGVADLAARQARVSETLMPASLTARFGEPKDGREPKDDDVDLGQFAEMAREVLSKPMESVYDGGRMITLFEGRWTILSPSAAVADRDGPRGLKDPLWPLDALYGARDDAEETGPEDVRGVATIRYRLTVDLVRADAALPAGVSVPEGPYRALSQLPAEVWLDDDGLIRRVAVTQTPGAPAGSQHWVVAELWDFGVAAEINMPPPDQVLTLREAAREETASEEAAGEAGEPDR
jgi:hypothetical protein